MARSISHRLRKAIRLAVDDPVALWLVLRVRRERLTYLTPDALADLRRRMRSIERHGIRGSVIEAGCALGGSAIVLARSKARGRPMFVYDVFGTIPPPSDEDGTDVHQRYEEIIEGRAVGLGRDEYYGYQPELKEKVAASFARHGVALDHANVSLVEGLFEDTLHPDGPVALAHLDGDWYESVKVCLERVWPQLAVGGAVVIDDYNAWSGCRKAVDEFIENRADVRFENWSVPHLVKVARSAVRLAEADPLA